MSFYYNFLGALVIFISAFALRPISGQTYHGFEEYEEKLKNIAVDILNGENDSVRSDANSQFLNLLKEALKTKDSFRYPFDSLITIARLKSADDRFRIFNWNMPKDNGTFEYFGIIQSKSKHSTGYNLFQLFDCSGSMEQPDTITGTAENWYGAHYYRIISVKHRSSVYYTLLGWDGYNRLTTRKIIEILTFSNSGAPLFGLKVFPNYDNGNNTRIIFEYSSSSSMSLKYELQAYKIYKRNKIKVKPREMIVFDHLEPLDPMLGDQRRYYVPSGEIFDGFVFRKGKWIFYNGVIARQTGTENSDKKPVELELFQ